MNFQELLLCLCVQSPHCISKTFQSQPIKASLVADKHILLKSHLNLHLPRAFTQSLNHNTGIKISCATESKISFLMNRKKHLLKLRSLAGNGSQLLFVILLLSLALIAHSYEFLGAFVIIFRCKVVNDLCCRKYFVHEQMLWKSHVKSQNIESSVL